MTYLISIIYYYVEQIYNIYIHAMCASLYACRLLIMPDAGLTSNVSVTLGISGGISCQMTVTHCIMSG